MRLDSELTGEQYAYRRGRTEYQKQRTLRAQTTLKFIAKFPGGATRDDFHKAGVQINYIDTLLGLKLIIASQVKEPEKGSRSYHWLWKIRKEDTL